MKQLPGLYLDENVYVSFSCVDKSHIVDVISQYIRGSIATDDWAGLRDRTQAVSKFILTDVSKTSSEERISPAAYFRLALSQEPGIPFFPHLTDLIIVDADASLAYLELLLTPSLISLEVSRIPNAKQPTLFSFLTTLAQVAPLLQNLTFGPGQFTSKSIQTILQFKNLRQLELKDAVSNMTFSFLESLGSSLPALESLILDTRSCEYIPSTAIMSKDLSKGINEHTSHASFGTNLEPMDGKNDEESPQNDTPQSDTSDDVGDAFSQLMKLHVIGSQLFIADLILQIASTRLEDVSITVVISRKVLEVKEELVIEKKVETKWEAKEEMQAVNSAPTGKRMTKKAKQREADAADAAERDGEFWRLSKEMEIRLGELEGESEEERRLRAINEQKRERGVNIFSALLQLLPTRWSKSLKTISVVNASGHSTQHVLIPTLLNEVFRLLLFHPTIEKLTVKGWTPVSVEDSILGLAEMTPSNLKSLFLPLDEANSGISWSTLRHIAITCPKLQSLQCRIKPLSLIPKYTVPTTEVLFHGLQTLSVGNSFPDLHSNELYLIARHLDLLFPHLETITTFEHDTKAEPWIVVNELVKMCQTARIDERYRASAMQLKPSGDDFLADVTTTLLSV